MGYTYRKTIETSIPCDHNKVKDKYISNQLYTCMLLQTYTKKFSEGDKEWKLPHLARPQQ